MTRGPIAVTGASGNVGGAVIDELVSDGDRDVVAVVRDPARVRADHAATVRVADYSEPAAIRAALNGVETLVFVSSDGEAAPMLIHHSTVVKAARRADVGRIVYLSIIDVEPSSPFCYAPVHRETERLLRTSGLAYSVVRAGLYGELFTRWLVEAARIGVLRLPIGSGRMSLVSRDDVSHGLAAAALQADSGTHLITGSQTYDLQQLAAMAEQMTQSRVRPVDSDDREFCTDLLRGGTSPWWAYAFTTMFQSIRDHRFEMVTDHLVKLTGQAPTPFDDMARRALDAA